ncbi:hypothetical protein GCM10010123_34410 [Pilimelia anulata]|uniref:HdeD family acid-resistance protein n=1 Tax=Pilimelia anulata TaxID=53371 RepID=A0A8J3FER9_9ACTN|nr:hypothetical protein [Pilimelia anulata]GGK01681.1 hypothetical protein GCM10010123_34410 [Pilimelia anulata]
MGSPTTSAELRVSQTWTLPDPWADTRAEARALREHQRLSVATAAAAIVSAGALAVTPPGTIAMLAAVLGAWLVVSGALQLAEAALTHTGTGAARALAAVGGLLHVSVGVVCVRGLLTSPGVLAIVLGMAWLAGGIAGLLAATSSARGGWALQGAVLTAAAAIAAGLALAFWPGITLPGLRGVALGLLASVAGLHVLLTVRATRPADC